MPSSVWSGALSFGLVTVPVKLYPAVTRRNVRFNEIDAATGSRIRHRKVAASTGEEVEPGQVVKGYEISKDQYVIIEPTELEALDPAASRTIDLVKFVDLEAIDPVFYSAAYILAPDELARKAYRVLVDALHEADKTALARFVMRSKQYLAAVRSTGTHLVMSTMVYADEINEAATIVELQGLEELAASDQEVDMARLLIDSLAGDFDPDEFTDEHRAKVLALIERKASGSDSTIQTIPAAADSEGVVDLMEALEASVAAAKEARKRHPSANTGARAAKKADKPKSRRKKSA